MEDEDDLHNVVRKLEMYCEHVGLKVNMEKAEYLVVGDDKIEDLELENELWKGVERFKYLGVAFNKYGHSDEEITIRIDKGRNCIGALNSVLWNKNTRNTKKLL
jgi:hypothetical protein